MGAGIIGNVDKQTEMLLPELDNPLAVTIAGVRLANPVMTASGTFGSGMEYSEFVDLNRLGAVVTKGVADVPWEGNAAPRVAEVYGGMLNAIGLQNPGIDTFLERDLPFLTQFDTRIIVNVCGHTEEEYLRVVERLQDQPAADSAAASSASASSAGASSAASSSMLTSSAVSRPAIALASSYQPP